jgi:hypothetical protein
MDNIRSDTLVFFGATGDLAYKKIFSSLQAMIKRGNLNVPVIGVAKAGWNLEQFHARIKDAVEQHGGIDPAAFRKLISLVRYVDYLQASRQYQYERRPSQWWCSRLGHLARKQGGPLVAYGGSRDGFDCQDELKRPSSPL